MGAGEVVQGLKPVAAMVVVQVVFAGVNIFYKLAVVCDGMDMRVLVAYRYLFASAVLAPLAYFVERSLPNIIPSSLLFSSLLFLRLLLIELFALYSIFLQLLQFKDTSISLLFFLKLSISLSV